MNIDLGHNSVIESANGKKILEQVTANDVRKLFAEIAPWVDFSDYGLELRAKEANDAAKEIAAHPFAHDGRPWPVGKMSAQYWMEFYALQELGEARIDGLTDIDNQ